MTNGPTSVGPLWYSYIMKTCLGCGSEKPLDDYYFKNKAKKLYRSRCKSCYLAQNSETMSSAESNKRYRENNPRSARNSTLKALYNITIDDYEKLLEDQGGVCKACKGINADGKRLSVDHDHSCCSGKKSCGKCIRGLLCNICNTTLGKFEDSVNKLRGLVTYLDENTRYWQ